MSDTDRVFARFTTPEAAAAPSRQTVTIPGRGTRGSHVVEVVHLRHGGGAVDEAPARHAADVGGAAWGDEISGKGSVSIPVMPGPAAPAASQPVVHLMPAWEPKPVESQAAPQTVASEPEQRPETKATRRPRAASPTRRVADPFDPNDDGANCIRCGYLVETTRERRGLATCAACG